MNPINVTVGPIATAVATAVAIAQAVAAAGNLVINGTLASGGVATLDVARRVRLTSGGDDRNITFTVYGTNSTGAAIYETITGSNGTTADSTADFKTVTRIAASGAVATTIAAGTNGVASSQWFPIDIDRNPISIAAGFSVSGTVNYTVEETYDDPNVQIAPGNYSNASIAPLSNIPPKPWADSAIVTKAADFQGTITQPFFAFRLVLNSGTGSVKGQFIQAGQKGA